jgi:GNAT superfamily N-acetyltransferase
MFRGPQLLQLTPGTREDDVWPSNNPADIHTRFALATDAELLRDMVVAAVNWAPGRAAPREEVLVDPRNAHYVDGWPRDGDLGVVAVATWEINRWAPVLVGAAWLRYFTDDDSGYGFIASDVPELSIGVDTAQRGRGIGTRLIRRLLQAATEVGIERISLSVERQNPAMRLYEREGFRVTDEREGEDSLTMIVDVPGGQ